MTVTRPGKHNQNRWVGTSHECTDCDAEFTIGEFFPVVLEQEKKMRAEPPFAWCFALKTKICVHCPECQGIVELAVLDRPPRQYVNLDLTNEYSLKDAT